MISIGGSHIKKILGVKFRKTDSKITIELDEQFLSLGFPERK